MSEAKHADINLPLVETWLREAGDIALRGRSSLHSISKLDGSLVTDVDHQIETYLYKQISQQYPEHQILAEEGIRHGKEGEYLWTIDPIDGTRAYASGLPIWGLSIGILKQGEPYAGFFFMPVIRELYFGKNDTAFLNNQLISRPSVTEIETSTAFFAVPSNAHRHFDIAFHRVRSLGSTTAHLAYVARGAALASLTRRLFVWDILPMLPLLKTTGIALIYLSGQRFDLRPLLDGSPAPEPLIAAPAEMIEHVQEMIRSKP